MRSNRTLKSQRFRRAALFHVEKPACPVFFDVGSSEATLTNTRSPL